ncbi:MAG TPA: SEC-C domain-containing protein [Streptosporangiaceae bacterium]|nr:SEC-C domain-containing protein [Streptosporangiaceae bacterium]
METPAHERRSIEEYLRSQSGDGFEIEHVEKLTSEYVYGRQYDVWDAHTSDGRWWVITNPVNLYSQEQIKSMDIALSFHIGLMSRVMARQPRRAESEHAWVLEVLRRLDVAGDSLDRAREVEDFQAVGMRLREALLTLGAKLADQGYQSAEGAAELQKGNFKAWAALCADSIAAGSGSQHLRALLKALGEKTWNYVAWLTHARNAGRSDAQIALSAVSQAIDAFIAAISRQRLGAQARCPVCASYQLTAVPALDGGHWVKVCAACGWEAPADPLPLASDHDPAAEEERPVPEGECTQIEDLGIYLTPEQARQALEQAADQLAGYGEQGAWANPFAFFFAEDASLADAHRIAYTTFVHAPAPGAELTYPCDDDACVNPRHARETPLPDDRQWTCGIAEKVTCHPAHLEIQISAPGQPSSRVFADRATLDRYGFADASSLTERVVFLTEPDEQGRILLLPAARRSGHAHGTAATGWLHPARVIADDQTCPCGSGKPYATCHGMRFTSPTAQEEP